MASLKVHPIRRIRATIQVPGDKSISHRSALIGGLTDGELRVNGFLPSEDCLASLSAMQALGVEVERITETSFILQGRGGKLTPALEPIDCGNSGTTIRLLAGVLAGQPDFSTRLFGDESLARRPMKRIVDPLEQMGAQVQCEGKDQRPPLIIKGAKLKPIHHKMSVASAQLKSCILLAGIQTEGKTIVEQPIVCRDHTERMLEYFRASIKTTDRQIEVFGGGRLYSRDLEIPGDFSSAAFWLVAAAALPGAQITLPNVGLNPTRTGLLNVLMRMGAQIKEHVEDAGVEPRGTLTIEEGTRLRGTTISGNEIPNVIDELPIIAVAGALAEGTTIIKDAQELRVKESDRLAALALNLRAFGVPVEETPDGLIIQGRAQLKGARVESLGDHRIAMAFSILALFAEGSSHINNTACIATSYPTFERDLQTVLDADLSGRFSFKWPFGSRKKNSNPATD
jgi:3-phosphoshikimate 1-carboxyvinyltransferase